MIRTYSSRCESAEWLRALAYADNSAKYPINMQVSGLRLGETPQKTIKILFNFYKNKYKNPEAELTKEYAPDPSNPNKRYIAELSDGDGQNGGPTIVFSPPFDGNVSIYIYKSFDYLHPGENYNLGWSLPAISLNLVQKGLIKKFGKPSFTTIGTEIRYYWLKPEIAKSMQFSYKSCQISLPSNQLPIGNKACGDSIIASIFSETSRSLNKKIALKVHISIADQKRMYDDYLKTIKIENELRNNKLEAEKKALSSQKAPNF